MSKRVLTIISIIIGACGILYGGINAFVKDPGKLPILGSFLGNPGDITLLLLGLLLVIVGVQNLDLLSDMNEGVERIEDIAKQVLSRLAVNPETDCVRRRGSNIRLCRQAGSECLPIHSCRRLPRDPSHGSSFVLGGVN